MAATAQTSKAKTPRPSGIELGDDDPRFAAVVNTTRGRAPIPSVYTAEVEKAAANPGKWYAIDATTAYPVSLIQREIKKGEKQWNKANPNAQIKVVTHVREDSAGLPPFVAYHAEPVTGE